MPTSSTLINTGKLGAGTSVLMANVIDDLNLHIAKQSASLAYFFYQHDIEESSKSRTVVGSLAQQLLCRKTVNISHTEFPDVGEAHLDEKAIIKLIQAGFLVSTGYL
jgi:hypothetical protein